MSPRGLGARWGSTGPGAASCTSGCGWLPRVSGSPSTIAQSPATGLQASSGASVVRSAALLTAFRLSLRPARGATDRHGPRCGAARRPRPSPRAAAGARLSLRATATTARRLPRLPPRAASASPQRRRSVSGPKGPRTYWAAPTSRRLHLHVDEQQLQPRRLHLQRHELHRALI
jgi:hypothetical protein